MSKTVAKPAANEEWQDIAAAGGRYDPTLHADLLRAARAGIRTHRMREVELRLLRRDGTPLAATEITVEQLSHAFPFGDQVWELDALIRDGRGDSDRARAWKQRFAELFNAATSLCYWTERPRNDAAKTEDRQGEPRLENVAATVDWTLAQGMLAKGHPLFWSIPKCLPEWVKRYDPETLMKFAEVRVRSLVARFKGRVRIWDAVNEALWEATPKNLAKRHWPHVEPLAEMVEYIVPVLRWCREEDPDALYVVNDYGLEQEGEPLVGNDGSLVSASRQRRRLIELLDALAAAGHAPDAVGLQSHTGGWLGHAEQWRLYDQFAAAGWPVHITEFWAHPHEMAGHEGVPAAELDQLQAEYVANYLTCAFGHPNVRAFFFWGLLSEAIQWRDNLSGHELKPVYGRIQALLHDEWRTRETLRSDADGVVRFRGFHGRYAARRATACGVRTLGSFAIDPVAGLPLTLTAGPG